jgi:hypothetical protein
MKREIYEKKKKKRRKEEGKSVRAGNLHLKFYQALAPHSFTQSS